MVDVVSQVKTILDKVRSMANEIAGNAPGISSNIKDQLQAYISKYPKRDNLSAANSLMFFAVGAYQKGKTITPQPKQPAVSQPANTQQNNAKPLNQTASTSSALTAQQAATKSQTQSILNDVRVEANKDASLKDKILGMVDTYKKAHPNLLDPTSANALLAQARNLVLQHQESLAKKVSEAQAQTDKLKKQNQQIISKLNNPALAGVSTDITSDKVPAISTAVSEAQKQLAQQVSNEQQSQAILKYQSDQNTATFLGSSNAANSQIQKAGGSVGGVTTDTNLLPGGSPSFPSSSLLGGSTDAAGSGTPAASSNLPFGLSPMQLLFGAGIIVAGVMSIKGGK